MEKSLLLTDGVADILASLRRKGVRLWSENGELRYKAPKGALTPEDLRSLRACRAVIVPLLRRAVGAQLASPSRPQGHQIPKRAPLAFSQLTHWNLYRLGERPSARWVASGLRLLGPLNVEVLRKCIGEIVRRHSALRTRIVILEDGTPMQEVAECGDFQLSQLSLPDIPEASLHPEVERLFDDFVSEPVDVTTDPLFAARLLRLHQHEHVLLVAMEHMISDGFSLNVLLDDILSAYEQISSGRKLAMPAVPVQFAEYATWQRNTHKDWLDNHGPYWAERLRGSPRVRFPSKEATEWDAEPALGVLDIDVDKELTDELREWCRHRKITLVMGVLTAFAALALRWCSVRDMVIRYQTDGRFTPDLQRSIGYFAFPLHLRIEIPNRGSFEDLLRRVAEEYYSAYEHADFSYVEAQLPRPDFSRNTWFNWLPQRLDSGRTQIVGQEGTLECARVVLGRRIIRNFELDMEPMMGFLETDRIRGALQFSLNHLSWQNMHRFAGNFRVFLEQMLRAPNCAIEDIAVL